MSAEFPTRITVEEFDTFWKELQLSGGRHEWYEGGDGTRIIRIGRRVAGYRRDGDEWVLDGNATIGALMADFMREKMEEPSFASRIFRITEDKK